MQMVVNSNRNVRRTDEKTCWVASRDFGLGIWLAVIIAGSGVSALRNRRPGLRLKHQR